MGDNDSRGRCVVVGGADINNYDYVKSRIGDRDFIVYCDSGLRHMEGLQRMPNLIVGDFDSHENPHLNVETIVLPCEKDDTDTVYAVKEAIRRGFREFLLTGVVGARLDHTIGNVSILLYLDGLGLEGIIIDDYSEMEVVSGRTARISDEWKFFSLLNISGNAGGITITGAKYPLSNGKITCEYQYGVSNEVLPGCTAEVKVSEGRLLLIKGVTGDGSL